MNIGIPFYMRGMERDGIGWSLTHLLHGLLGLGSGHRFTVFTNVPADVVRAEFHHSGALDVVSFGMPRYTLWEQVGLPLAMARRDVDLCHSPLGLPLLCPSPGVATIHDLCFLSHRATFTRRMFLYFRIFLPLAVRRARIVVTVSETSKRALCRRLGVPAAKVRVIPNGVTDDFRPVTDAVARERVRQRYGLPPRFVLYVGTVEPRKNVLGLVRACERLWSKNEIAEKLVVVGKPGWLSHEVFDFIARPDIRDHVVTPGYVAREDLPVIYSLASVFVYPSLCEGFGLPPLEAMACGTPVVASDTSAMPEVLGSAAALVDPLDVDDLARTIAAVLGDAAFGDRLRTAGLERAGGYRWETSARQMVSVYEELGAGT